MPPPNSGSSEYLERELLQNDDDAELELEQILHLDTFDCNVLGDDGDIVAFHATDATESNNYEPPLDKINLMPKAKDSTQTLATGIIKAQNRFFKSRNRKQCDFCDFSTSASLDTLHQHLIDQHCELIFHCTFCDGYLPRLQLMAHVATHADNCNKASNATNTAISNAVEDIEGATKSNFHCQKCNKSFRSISGIKYHMNSKHVQLNVFACPHCSAKFSAQRVLQNHIHSQHLQGKRSYMCETCGKAFKTDSNLYVHRRLHMVERPHKCNQCDKDFRLKHHLMSHMIQHVKFENPQQLPYECIYCQKRFSAADNLRKHKKIHDHTSVFTCRICGAQMRQKRYLRQHKRLVHLSRE